MRNECLITRRDNYPVCVGFLIVNYTANLQCYISNGTVTRYATDRSGYAVFKVPYVGTWTVYLTDGMRTKSTSVTVSYPQTITVNISFAEYLYQAGDSGSRFTINTDTGVTTTFGPSYVESDVNSWTLYQVKLLTIFSTQSKVNFTNFNELQIKYSYINWSKRFMDGEWHEPIAAFSVGNQSIVPAEMNPTKYADDTNLPAGVVSRKWIHLQETTYFGPGLPWSSMKTETFNVSNLTGDYYINWGILGLNEYRPCDFRIYEISLI